MAPDTTPVPTIDPIKESLANLISISFSKSRSPNYLLAVNVARGAHRYEEVLIGGQTVHLAVFARSAEDAGRAATILDYLSTVKSTQVFAGGVLVRDKYRILEVIDCYLQAARCTDPTAHCHVILEDPFDECEYGATTTMSVTFDGDEIEDRPGKSEDVYLFPCAHLRKSLRLHKYHPSAAEKQIQASAVAAGCDWCPLFDASKFKKLGTKITVNGKESLIVVA